MKEKGMTHDGIGLFCDLCGNPLEYCNCEDESGGKPRWIPLNAELRKTLLHFLRWKKTQGESLDPEAPLICNRKGDRAYGPRDFERHLQAAGYAVLHRRIIPHDLRHTFATRLSRKGNLPALQQLLGHASLEATQAYTHPNREDLLQLVEEA